MPKGRSNTRIGEDIAELGINRNKSSSVIDVCSLMDEILDKKYSKISEYARKKLAEDLLIETTDFRSLYFIKNGMCG